jgi:hypothetical protein
MLRRLRSRGQFAFVVFATFVAFFAGCGGPPEEQIPAAPKGPISPVKGSVTLPDGKPLTEGEITFMPVKQPGRVAHGKIQTDGTYTLTTENVGEGAVEGAYKVKIESELTVPGERGKGKRYLVHQDYRDEDGSGLEATVKTGENNIPFKLANKPVGLVRGRDSRRRD